jgi:hypothetical protein
MKTWSGGGICHQARTGSGTLDPIGVFCGALGGVRSFAVCAAGGSMDCHHTMTGAGTCDPNG